VISALEFVDVLEQKDLLPPDLIRLLRDRIKSSSVPVMAIDVARRLITMERLTPTLAERILTASYKQAEVEADDLGLVPLEDEPDAKRTPDKPLTKGATPGSSSSAKQKPGTDPRASTPPDQTPDAPPPSSGSLLEEELGLGGGSLGAGPLDDLLANTALDSSAAAGGPLTAVAPKGGGLRRLFARKKNVVKRPKGNVWDSPLLLIGGGSLLGLMILGLILLWALMRQSGDEMLQLAHADYRAGSYTQAIHKYNLYLKKFPNHIGVSLARVRRGLAQLRQVAEGTSNWPKALEVAKGVLADIAPEPDFREARGELASLLPGIAEGLAESARKTLDPKMVAKSRETLALVDKYVPKSLRPGVRLDDVNASLALVERRIAYGKELAKAVAAIREALTKGEPERSYQVRRTLLKQYPEAADGESLKAAMLAVSQAERAAVKAVDKQQAAELRQRPDPLLATTTLARYDTKQKLPGGEGRVVFALAEGAAYGLDAATGAVLWRRFVGYDVDGRTPVFPPTPVDQKPGSDVILVDAAGNEVLCVRATTGELRWRHPLGESFDAHPVVTDNRLLIATRSGRLVSVDIKSGNSSGYVQLPQELRLAPAVDARRAAIYLLAEHSNLFVLSQSGGECRQVVYLGHESGSITAPPVIAGEFLVVAENDRLQNGVLRVLRLETEGEGPPVAQVQSIRLKGHVDRAPRVSGNRVLVTTDRAAYYVFELSGTDPKQPLMKVAEIGSAGDEGLIHFALLERSRFWVADKQLARYDVQASRGRLVPKWIIDEGSAFLLPPVAVGQAVVSVLRAADVPGVLVAAVDMEEGRRFWQTNLSAPLAAQPRIDNQQDTDKQKNTLTAVTSCGGMYKIDASTLKGQTVVDRPTLAVEMAELGRGLVDAIDLGANRLALSTGAGSKHVIVFDPSQTKKRFLRCATPFPLACPPVGFGNGLLAPCQVGQVFLLDPLSGENLVEPFQPRIEAGVKLQWRRPVVSGDNEIILADAAGIVYRVGVKKTPKPHFAELAHADLDQPIVSPLATLDGTVYLVDGGDSLVALELPKLSRGKDRLLGDKCTWGPARVGDCLMLATDEELLCLGADGKLRWQIILPYGRPVGTPAVVGDKYLFASATGVVWAVEAAGGKESASLELGRPLATGPVVLSDQLLLGGHDGTLYLVKQP